MPKPKTVAVKRRVPELRVWTLTMLENIDDYKMRGREPDVTIVGCYKTERGALKALLAKKSELVSEHSDDYGMDWIPEKLRHVIVEIKSENGLWKCELNKNATEAEVEELFELYKTGEFIPETVSFSLGNRLVLD